MTIQKVYEGEALILKIQGRVDANTGEEFSERVTDACRESGQVKLDLSEAPYFSSAGLRGLIMGQKILNLKGGRLELYGVSDVILKILQDTGLDQSLVIYRGRVGEDEDPVERCEAGSPAQSASFVAEVPPQSGKREITGFSGEAELSPGWVTALAPARSADQLFIAAVQQKTAAWISFHEKDGAGRWRMLLSTVGFIGKEGLGSPGEPNKTPIGTGAFDRTALTRMDDRRAFTDGRIALPEEKLSLLLSRVSEDCVAIVDTLERLGGML
ncbi:MAG: STAS domain-containing protein [Lachnospiraceae bacterium]|nr:STAS domain-containing protein [Lachnospiraceae bacterium]